eukprot:gene8508-24956_t
MAALNRQWTTLVKKALAERHKDIGRLVAVDKSGRKGASESRDTHYVHLEFRPEDRPPAIPLTVAAAALKNLFVEVQPAARSMDRDRAVHMCNRVGNIVGEVTDGHKQVSDVTGTDGFE